MPRENDTTSRSEADSTRHQDCEQLRGGSRDAFREVYAAFYEGLCQYAYGDLGSMEAAEDVVQEVLYDLWRRRATLQVRHSLKAFLYGAVRNQVLALKRSRRMRHVSGEEALRALSSAEDPEEAIHFEEVARFMGRAIADLPPRCRQVFILSRQHDLSYAEIGVALGISVKTVETHMGRALQQLRVRLHLFGW